MPASNARAARHLSRTWAQYEQLLKRCVAHPIKPPTCTIMKVIVAFYYQDGRMRFPEVQGSNLQGRRFKLPQDFGGEINVALIAFQQHQQYDATTWLPFLKQQQAQHPCLRTYELPTIWPMSRLRRTMLDMSMRLGIADRATRALTITLYLDKVAFRQVLDIPHEDTITVLVVNRAGTVLWRAQGAYNEVKGASLAATL
ncbi:hypothetical protein ACFLYO_11620, partial [Chloroflexota bacterium]